MSLCSEGMRSEHALHGLKMRENLSLEVCLTMFVKGEVSEWYSGRAPHMGTQPSLAITVLISTKLCKFLCGPKRARRRNYTELSQLVTFSISWSPSALLSFQGQRDRWGKVRLHQPWYSKGPFANFTVSGFLMPRKLLPPSSRPPKALLLPALIGEADSALWGSDRRTLQEMLKKIGLAIAGHLPVF